ALALKHWEARRTTMRPGMMLKCTSEYVTGSDRNGFPSAFRTASSGSRLASRPVSTIDQLRSMFVENCELHFHHSVASRTTHALPGAICRNDGGALSEIDALSTSAMARMN